MTGGAELIITLMALFALGVLACTAVVGILTRLVRGTEPEPPAPRRWWRRRPGRPSN